MTEILNACKWPFLTGCSGLLVGYVLGLRVILQAPCTDLVLSDAPCWIRTNDRLLRRQLLYPAELREQTLQSCQ